MARGTLRVTRASRILTVGPPGPGTIDFLLRRFRGGKREMLEYARMALAFEPRLGPVLALWDQLTPWQQRNMTVDALVGQVGSVTRGEFIGAVARAAFEFTDGITDLMVAAAWPRVLRFTVDCALTRNGHEDRRTLLEHWGSLPTRRPVTVRLPKTDPWRSQLEPEIPAFLREPPTRSARRET